MLIRRNQIHNTTARSSVKIKGKSFNIFRCTFVFDMLGFARTLIPEDKHDMFLPITVTTVKTRVGRD